MKIVILAAAAAVLMASPVVAQDGASVSFEVLDKDSDGTVDGKYWPKTMKRVDNLPAFEKVDTDGDSKLTKAEWDAYVATNPSPAPSMNVAK